MSSIPPTDLSFDASHKQQSLNILVVDDHPLTCKGYTTIIHLASEEKILPKASITLAHSGKEAFENLNKKKSTPHTYDLVMLDIRLPAYHEKNIFNGEDIGKLIRRHFKRTKILVLTSLNDNYRLHTILRSLNPEGLMLKSEINDKDLILAIQKVIHDVPFYSSRVLKIIKNQFIMRKEITLPERKFLYLLSTGVQSKDIPKHLPWSASKVEKQKRILKEKLDVEEKSVWGLIHKAKELGII